MKFFSLIISFLIASLFMVSCQKELFFDQSIGTLKSDSTDSCLGSIVNGTFKADSIIGLSNYIDVQVNVSIPGSYVVKSDTINGFSFYGAGEFGETGINTVRLYGNGKPVDPGWVTFIISYSNTFCLVDIEVLPGISDLPAVYTLGGAGGICSGFTISGTYIQGLELSSANLVLLNVTVSSPGTYSITTSSANGVSFSGSGIFTSVGDAVISLTGSGIPSAAGSFNYSVNSSGSSCVFSIPYVAGGQIATYTLGGSPGNCTLANVAGIYAAGTPVNSSNNVTITVNVQTIGSYSLGTNSNNGVTFTASSTSGFTTIGAQPLILYASGTPTAAGTYDYTITGGGSSCTFSVPFTSTPPTDFITCKIDGVFTTFNNGATFGLSSLSGATVLSIDGSTDATNIDPSISLGIESNASILPGIYTVNQLATGITVRCDYNDVASTNFLAQSLSVNQNPAFTIFITSFTATRIIGTFEGPVIENGGTGPSQKQITEGVFDVPIF